MFLLMLRFLGAHLSGVAVRSVRTVLLAFLVGLLALGTAPAQAQSPGTRATGLHLTFRAGCPVPHFTLNGAVCAGA
jgi:hypothetical protein